MNKNIFIVLTFLGAIFFMSSCAGSIKSYEPASITDSESSITDNGSTALSIASDKKTLPVAVNPIPSKLAELDKDRYLSAVDSVWEKGPENGKLTIPSAGILFKTGKSVIMPYYLEMINEFIALYKETDGKAKILIEGYSSNGGKETRNPKLSTKRAKAVANVFIQNKIPAGNLIIRSYGNKKIGSKIFDKDKGCKGGSCYRRVNISIK